MLSLLVASWNQIKGQLGHVYILCLLNTYLKWRNSFKKLLIWDDSNILINNIILNDILY